MLPKPLKLDPKTCSKNREGAVRAKHEQGKQILEIASAKMPIDIESHETSMSVTQGYGRNVLPAGNAPRML